MPMYAYKCAYCGNEHNWVLRQIEQRDEPEYCEKCNDLMERQLTTPAVRPFTPYFHAGLGQYFHSRSDENSYAKKNGLVNISRDFGKHYSWKDSSHGKKRDDIRNKARNSKPIIID